METPSRKKKALNSLGKQGFSKATLTGLEPATTGSTVRYSNQLSYSALFILKTIFRQLLSPNQCLRATENILRRLTLQVVFQIFRIVDYSFGLKSI